MKKITRQAISIFIVFLSLCMLSACAEWRSDKSLGENIDDSNIVAAVKAKLLANKDVPSKNISVNSQKGIVQLSGFVNNAHSAELALHITESVRGVRNVINHLEVIK